MEKPTVIDLFCGCGGMSWGLQNSDFDVLAGIDSWGRALTTFHLNHPHATTIEADITALDPHTVMKRLGVKHGELDCLIGGPPCQGFSKNVPAAYRFLEDPQNQLFRDFLRFVEAFLPKTVVMENVAEIHNAYDGSVRVEIVENLQKLDYDLDVDILYAPNYGVPQRRKRCFFFASRTGIKPVLPLPVFGVTKPNTLFDIVKPYRSAWDAISDLPVLQMGEVWNP